MSVWAEWIRRWRHLRNRAAEEASLAEEMRFHLEQRAAANGAEEARRRFGNVTALRERCRDEWGWPAIENTLADIRYAVRGLRRSPGFAAVAIASLAVAMGGSAAILSLAEATLARPLPYPAAEELTVVFEGAVSEGRARSDSSPANFLSLREETRTLRGLALYHSAEWNLTGEGEPERIDGIVASSEYFRTIGVAPYRGRFFGPDENVPGQAAVAVLSYELWQRRFAGDEGILNQKIRLTDVEYTVIGVLPPGFRYHLNRGEIWTPFAPEPAAWNRRGARYVYITGRRDPEVPLARVQAELDALSARLRREYPVESGTTRLEAVPLREALTENGRAQLYLLAAGVLCLLAIACANVAGLLLTRALGRENELAVRRALGASRGRVARQLLAEALVLAACGGVAGLGVTTLAMSILQPLVPSGMAPFTRLAPDGRTLVWLFALGCVVTIAAGLAPALRSGRIGATRAIGGRGQDRTRTVLLIAQVAMATVLLSGAALLLKTFSNLRHVDPGFRPEGLLSLQTVLPRALATDPIRRTRFYTDTLAAVRALPGVTNAAFASTVPTHWKGGYSGIHFAELEYDPARMVVMMRQATPGYFETMGMRLIAGRFLNTGDRTDSSPAVVVNEAFVSRYWPGQDVLGRRIGRGRPGPGTQWIEIVGVVGNVIERGVDADPPPITYFAETQQPAATFTSPNHLLVRTVGDPAVLAGPVRDAIRRINPAQAVARIRPVTEILDEETASPRLHSLLTSAFALTALFLSCLGIYGLLDYSVMQRRREFGLRLALGAAPSGLAGAVAGRGMLLAGTGLALGLALAAWMSRWMETLLYGVEPLDGTLYAEAAAVLALATAAASWIPARRIRRVDPADALRAD